MRHATPTPRLGVWGLERKDRIADLCNRAATEKDPAVLKGILDDLRASLAEYIREARRMTLLHFDYFRKHESFTPQSKAPSNDVEVAKNNRAENVDDDVPLKDVDVPLKEEKKKAS